MAKAISPKSSPFSFSPVAGTERPARWWVPSKEPGRRRWGGGAVAVGGERGPREIVVDFGKEVGGYLNVEFGPVRGGAVRFYFSEDLNELLPAGDIIWEPLFSRLSRFYTYTYRGRGGETWRHPTLRGGFRYLLVRAAPRAEAEIRDIEVELDFYVPAKGIYPGRFESSDKQLNKIWYAAAYTMQVATKRPWESFVHGRGREGPGEWVIFDGAKRDRAVWNLDLAISIPSYLLSLGNPAAVRDSLLTTLSQKGKGFYALRPGYIPHSAFPLDTLTGLGVTFNVFSVYVLWWIRGAWLYFLHTGDTAFARRAFKHVKGGLRWLETQTRPSPQSRTPLFFANGLNDQSWDYTVLRLGFSGATNLMWVRALEEAALMAGALGHRLSAGRFRSRAAAIRGAVMETGFRPCDLFDSRLGRFRHTTMQDIPFTLEVNALAVLFDLITGAAADRLLDTMKERLHVPWGSLSADRRFLYPVDGRHNRKVMPPLVALEATALFKRGRAAEALDLTRRAFVPMLEQGTGSTFWEWYGDNGRPPMSFASLCHPWSSCILEVLTSNLTGITPARPGFAEVALDPSIIRNAKEIKSLSFQIPTPHGPIAGNWERKRNKVHYEANLPEGVAVEGVTGDEKEGLIREVF